VGMTTHPMAEIPAPARVPDGRLCSLDLDKGCRESLPSVVAIIHWSLHVHYRHSTVRHRHHVWAEQSLRTKYLDDRMNANMRQRCVQLLLQAARQPQNSTSPSAMSLASTRQVGMRPSAKFNVRGARTSSSTGSLHRSLCQSTWPYYTPMQAHSQVSL
jgi:hypothetical protein